MAFLYEQEREKMLSQHLRNCISKLDCYFEHLLNSLGEVDKETLATLRTTLNEFVSIKEEIYKSNSDTTTHVQNLLKLSEEHVQTMINVLERKYGEELPNTVRPIVEETVRNSVGENLGETIYPMVEAEVSVLAPPIIEEKVENALANILNSIPVYNGESEDIDGT